VNTNGGNLVVLLIILAILVVVGRTLIHPVGRSDVQGLSGTFMRTYRGSLANASRAFQNDATALAPQGYVPVSQVYAPGSWGCGAFLIALVLFLVLIGILIFIYMLIVKPEGSLVVTYEYRSTQPASPPPTDPAAALGRLTDLRDRGVITAEEYAAKRAEILARI